MKRLVLLLVATLMIAGTLNAQTQWELYKNNKNTYANNRGDMYFKKYNKLSIAARYSNEKRERLKKIFQFNNIDNKRYEVGADCRAITNNGDTVWFRANVELLYLSCGAMSVQLSPDKNFYAENKSLAICFNDYLFDEREIVYIDIEALYNFMKSQKK